MTRYLLGAALLLAVALPAHADLLQMKDGRFIEGVKMEREGESIKLLYENGIVSVPLDDVADYVIEGVEPFEPTTDAEKEKLAAGLVPFRGKWVKAAVRKKKLAAELAKRRAEVKEYKQHSIWRNRYEFKTKNFLFESTLPEAINADYSTLMETYFKEFGKHWKVKVPKDWGKLRVCFYTDLDAFHRTGGVGGGVQAYYRFVAPRELNFFYDRRNPETTVAVMFHEANHYLTDLMDEKFQYPHWVNEAMAEYYGASTWDPVKKKMKLGGMQHGRLVEVRTDLAANKVFTVEQIVSSEAREYEHYYWGWCFVHFMMETPKYKKKFTKFFSDLARAKDVDRKRRGQFTGVTGAECLRVFKKRLGVSDLSEMQSEWYQHIANLDASALRGKELAGLAATRQGRMIRGKRLLKEAINDGSKDVSVHVRYAQLLGTDPGTQREALAILTRACELDPLEADTWALRGYLLRSMGQKEEGEKMMALAREIDPDNDFLHLEIAAKLREVLGEGD